MATISLRAYNRQIDQMIENGNSGQAIEHCLHILKRYPKHVDTYRLLGTAYLENSQFTEASDILQRLLSAVPDDRLAHIGLSVIREHSGNMDEALWHMERASEIQPNNRLLQDELRRLYGKRDGLEPPRIHLTRGALARTYVKGKLYQQAIVELESVLSEQPERLDLLLLLARTHHFLGNCNQACKTSADILNKLPYCLDANRIMDDCECIKKGDGSLGSHADRVKELDPYYTHVSEQYSTVEDVPDQMVNLDWMESPPEFEGKPEEPISKVPTGLGGEEGSGETIPDWIRDLEDEISTPAEPEGDEDLDLLPVDMGEADTHPIDSSENNDKPITDEDTKPIRVPTDRSMSERGDIEPDPATPDKDSPPGEDDQWFSEKDLSDQDPPND